MQFLFFVVVSFTFLSDNNWAQNIHSEWKILWLMHSIDCSLCYFVKCEALHTSRKAIILSPKSFFVAFIPNIAHFFTSKLFSTDYLRRFKFKKKRKTKFLFIEMFFFKYFYNSFKMITIQLFSSHLIYRQIQNYN